MILNTSDLEQLEQRYRANLINSLGGFKNAVLIGSISKAGNENLAIFNSLFHIGANSALCGIVVRPNEEKQNTLGNIISTGQYTINHVKIDFYKQAHQTSAKYAEGESEFEKVGLTSEYRDDIQAPFVKESNIKFACKLVQKIDIEMNGTFILIGEIVKLLLPDDVIHSDGNINLELAQSVCVGGLETYYSGHKLAQLAYAKTDKPIVEK